ncbi:MAG: DEAD/DEAH box helicase [Terrimesophilobacter sp.]
MSTELSPAQRYAASRTLAGTPRMDAFRRALSFDLDPFQLAACSALERGSSVLVAAPTGAGKTIVADFAVYLAMRDPAAKVFYTAPMKALSNQKYQDFVAEYGSSEVGLLTGDTNINSGARIVVMTTEVLRNMLYANSDLLKNLSFVVMDEVHYLADRFRGAVWEEVIIHLDQEVRLVSLSATVSNAEEFGDWLQAVRGETAVIVSEERPVPLDQHVLVRGKLLDLFASTGLSASASTGLSDSATVNPELVRLAGGRTGGQGRGHHGGRQSGYRERSGGESGRIDRAHVVRLLESKSLLPAIFFIFSRAGCDKAVANVLHAGVRLTNTSERDEIRAIVEERCRTLRDEDLAVLGYWQWLGGLERGVAAHHAGMLPAFKEVVEELFQRKLVRAVFATETLALGINMPARTVVLEKLEKFNGEARVPITPGEYTQLTGRAGRRGIDSLGHSVIQWQSGLDPEAVASLASRRTYPLNSSFKPTYNMAVNLVEQFGRERTRDILESSFAQFQADRSVVSLARKVRSQSESLDGYAKSMTCHLGDFTEYSALRRELTDLERKGARDAQSRADRERRGHQLNALRKRVKQHPCNACKDLQTHARWAERWWRLKKQTDELTGQIRERTGLIAKIFDRVSDVLLELGYLAHRDGTLVVGPHGRTLRRIYGERDLLVAECLRRGTWKQLDVAGIAAMATALVYEPRREDGALTYHHLPNKTFRAAFEKTTDLWSNLDDLEREHRLPGSDQPSAALCMAMYLWAQGGALDAVLRDAELAAGDFVRIAKQTIDLLDQISLVGDATVGPMAHAAVDAVRRGIVAYSSVSAA